MPITFSLLGGAEVTVQSNTHPMKTSRGVVPADEVVQGDRIAYVRDEPLVEVIAPPAVS